jgi:hypothetical protein
MNMNSRRKGKKYCSHHESYQRDGYLWTLGIVLREVSKTLCKTDTNGLRAVKDMAENQ